MINLRGPQAALLVFLAIVCQTSLAQGLVAPQPITSSQPPQPVNESGQRIDGWVTLRYSVLADGTTTNVRALNVMPPTIDAEPVLQAAAQWTFAPGTRDGAPIDWHNNETRVVFRSQGGGSPTADAFAEGYAAIGSLLEDGNHDAALAASDTLIAQNSARLSEIGLALVQQALIHVEREDYHSALPPLQMATDPRVPMLDGVQLFAALQLRMQVEQNLSHTYEAIQSYQRLAKGIGPNEPNQLQPQGDLLMQIWEEEPMLAVFGRIDNGSWRFDAGRPFFYIAGINGNISTIEADCETQRVALTFDPDADYQLPESFGACTLFVKGDEGTTFSLVEALPPTDG